MHFDSKGTGTHIEVEIPKYPETKPYFTEDDQKMLLESYMEYANMSIEEIREWYSVNRKEEQ